MRRDGLMGVHRRKCRRRRHDIATAPDRLNRDFTAERHNERWVAVIPEFRPVKASSMSPGSATSVTGAWSAGPCARLPTPSSCSTPSSRRWAPPASRGRPGASLRQGRRLRIGRLLLDCHPGRAQGQLKINRTLQTEWAYRQVFTTNDDRTDALAPWLDYYNHRRRHSALGGLPPISRRCHVGPPAAEPRPRGWSEPVSGEDARTGQAGRPRLRCRSGPPSDERTGVRSPWLWPHERRASREHGPDAPAGTGRGT